MSRIIETVVEYRTQPPCRSADEMEKICCETSPALQCCEKIVPEWDGHTADELLKKYHPDLDDQGRDAQGRYVIIELAPRTKPCGELVVKYDVSGGNCCDEVPPVSIDHSLTPDILPAGKNITVYWSGGDGKYTIKTLAANTSFDNGHKVIAVDGNSTVLHAGLEFCGSAIITVEDACSQATIAVRSDQGQWVPVGDICLLSGEAVDLGSDTAGNRLAELIVGNIKQIEKQRVVNSYDLGWVGGIHCDDRFLAAGCPQKDGNLATICRDCGGKDLEEILCECVTGAGYPKDRIEPCSILPRPELSDRVLYCGAHWLRKGGGLSINCNIPGGGTVSGSVSGYYLEWYSHVSVKTYRWVC